MENPEENHIEGIERLGKSEECESGEKGFAIETRRRRTDPCWFLSFMYFLILWCCVIIYAFMEGDPEKYLRPVDNEGRECDWNTPYLVQYNREDRCDECLMCRPDCPQEDFVFPDWTKLTADLPAANSSELLQKTLNHTICKPDVRLSAVKSWEQLQYLVENKHCARTYNKTKVVKDGRCDYEDKSDRFEGWKYSLPRLARDIARTRKSIIGFVMLAGWIAVASIMFLRFYALTFTGFSIFVLYSVVFNFIYEKFVIDRESTDHNGVLWSLVISVILLILLVLVTTYFWNTIASACHLLTECSKAIIELKSTILWSLLLAVIALSVLDLGFRISIGLRSIESPVYEVSFAPSQYENCTCPSSLGYRQGDSCDLQDFKKCRTPDRKQCVLSGCFVVGQELKTNWMWQIVNGVSVYWFFWVIVGFQDMTVAGVFATWYWTMNRNILKKYLIVAENFWRIITFHLGTLVLGALIILVCKITRALLNFVNDLLMRTKQPLAAVVLLHLKCVFDLTESFLDYVDQRAYIMCAIHGADFMDSAHNGYNLLKRNLNKIVFNIQISNWLLVALAFLIAFTIARISTSYFSAKSDLTYTGAPSTMVFFGSFVVCFMILRVLEMAVTTIFYSLLQDCELNEGNPEKSFYASPELVKLLCNK